MRGPQVGGKNWGGCGEWGQKQDGRAEIGLRVTPGFCPSL